MVTLAAKPFTKVLMPGLNVSQLRASPDTRAPESLENCSLSLSFLL